jgi:hypothetical protein
MANDLEHRTNLERRRRAIADALRAIMAEPLPDRQPATPVASVVATLPAERDAYSAAEVAEFEPAAVHDEHAALAAEDRIVTAEWDDEEHIDRPESLVPPLETVGSMSRRASMALFGHA